MFYREMDKEGMDENITCQAFSTLAYSPDNQGQASALTVHTTIETLEDALVCLPKHPHTVFKVPLNTERMELLEDLTHKHKADDVNIPNFYKMVTECGPDTRLRIRNILHENKGQTDVTPDVPEATASTSTITKPDTKSKRIVSTDIPTPETGAIPKTTTEKPTDDEKSEIEQ